MRDPPWGVPGSPWGIPHGPRDSPWRIPHGPGDPPCGIPHGESPMGQRCSEGFTSSAFVACMSGDHGLSDAGAQFLGTDQDSVETAEIGTNSNCFAIAFETCKRPALDHRVWRSVWVDRNSCTHTFIREKCRGTPQRIQKKQCVGCRSRLQHVLMPRTGALYKLI